jgi:gamma-glutamylcyclotransferase (GGCT)/AIG2-like uncharacterized protein YtfP
MGRGAGTSFALEPPVRVFVYGTLKKPKIQKEVFGRTTIGVRDFLRGFTRSSICLGDSKYPIIIPKNNHKVFGLIIRVTQKELKKIDRYETDAYKRKLVVLGSGVSAWVYVKGKSY